MSYLIVTMIVSKPFNLETTRCHSMRLHSTRFNVMAVSGAGLVDLHLTAAETPHIYVLTDQTPSLGEFGACALSTSSATVEAGAV